MSEDRGPRSSPSHPEGADDELEAAGRAVRPGRWAGRLFSLALAAVALYVGGRSIAFMLREPAPRVGELAPTFALTSIDGEPFDLERHRGKVVVLDFWATWCSGCVAFLPAAARIERDYRDQGLVWLGLHVPPGTADEARAFLAAKGLRMATAMAPASLAERWGVAQTPSYVVIDRAGYVRAVFYAMAAEPQLRKVIEPLLAQRP